MSNRFYRRYGKRLFDLVVSLTALIVLSPVLAVTAFLVRVLLGSPVIFRQDRPGYRSRVFHICKFRTMTDGRDADGNLLDDSLRHTAFGKFLRSSSLDELPELWNVLKGEMSLVGPRPLRTHFLPHYSPEQARRHDVIPGITGWAQVNGRNQLSWEDRFRCDVWYVDNLSFSLDLKILWMTIVEVFNRTAIDAADGGEFPDFTGTKCEEETSSCATGYASALSLQQRKINTGIASGTQASNRERLLATTGIETSTKQIMTGDYAMNDQKLALEGGTPIRAGAMSPWPCFDDELIEAASKVLRSNKVNYWTGEECKLFEQEYAQAIGSKHAIALTNGTVALELALYGLGIGPGDEVIVPSRTFIASASCAVMRGATPIVADVDRDSQTLTTETIRKVMTPRTRAIVAVHLAGWPCDLDPIMELARQHGIKVIEDCAQAHHATYKGRQVGTIGDVAAFSFCQDKIMTTGGEGGLMTTNDTELWDRCWSFKDHGKSREAVMRPHQPHRFRWLHHNFGTNWRLTEMQAAMGRIMLRRLASWVEARRANAARLDAALASVDSLRIPKAPRHVGHSYYKYYAFVRPECLRDGWSRDRIVQNLQAEGIPCGPGSCSEIYLEQAFADCRPAERLPVARELGETSLMFMVHPTLKTSEIDETAHAIQKVMRAATRSGSVSLPRAA